MLVDTDYYPTFIWMTYIEGQTGVAILEALTLIFCCPGYPENFISDRSHSLTSCEISCWCKAKDIKRIMSSPYNPASNGKVEGVVDIVKYLLKKTRGNSMAFREALLVYHDTPVGSNLTIPAKLMNSYPQEMEIPTVNCSSGCDRELAEK